MAVLAISTAVRTQQEKRQNQHLEASLPLGSAHVEALTTGALAEEPQPGVMGGSHFRRECYRKDLAPVNAPKRFPIPNSRGAVYNGVPRERPGNEWLIIPPPLLAAQVGA